MSVVVDPPPVESLDAGVIEDARRRQRRHRVAAVAAALAGGLAAILALGSTGGAHRTPAAPPPLRVSSSLTWLTGPALKATHLRLVASENGGPAFIVDVARGSVTSPPELDVPTSPMLGPFLSLSPVPGGALAVVNHQACGHCAITEADFLIGATGSVRRVATRYFPSFTGTTEREQVPGSTAEWVLTWPHRGPCALRLVPSTHPAVTVPCGDLGAVLPSGVALWTHNDTRGILVDPLTGAVLGHLSAVYRHDLIGHGVAVEGPPQGYGSLSLVNLTTGTRRLLGWPSRLHFGYQLFPDPAGPFVAIEFADPAYPGYSVTNSPSGQTIGQAGDIWVLDTRTASLTHVPGFPILLLLKQSGVAWTADGRLVIIARGGAFAQRATRTVIGLWHPGQRTMPVSPVPALDGYSQFVALAG